jgi:hypothetical protein
MEAEHIRKNLEFNDTVLLYKGRELEGMRKK